MTDNEIIKALECCRDGDCKSCTFDECTTGLLDKGIALDLINRQKAEIEKLEAEVEKLEFRAEIDKRDYQRKLREGGNAVDVLYQLYDEGVKKIQQLEGKLKIARAEAIKEFAERLLGLYSTCTLADTICMDALGCDIKRLVKEMVGDDK